MEELEKLKIPKGKSTSISTLWDSDRKQAVRDLNECISARKESNVEQALINFKNLLVTKQLYLSVEIIKNLNTYADNINKLFIINGREYIDSLPVEDRADNRKKCQEIELNLRSLLNEIVDTMRDELSVGYYKANCNK